MFAVIVIAVVAVGAVIYAGGSHTMHGFGHDMKNTGQRIEHPHDNNNGNY
jgi:predicted small secreted protein